MSAFAQTATVNLEHVHCKNCGLSYALPANFLKHRRERGGRWRCPNLLCDWVNVGYSETEIERLRKQVEEKDRRIAFEANARRTAEEQLATAEKRSARLRKRVAAGVCPCCKRTFQQLSRHMKTKHPEYGEEK
jgi:hypothetical protein